MVNINEAVGASQALQEAWVPPRARARAGGIEIKLCTLDRTLQLVCLASEAAGPRECR